MQCIENFRRISKTDMVKPASHMQSVFSSIDHLSIAPQPSTGWKASSQTSLLAVVVAQLMASPACQAAKFGA